MVSFQNKVFDLEGNIKLSVVYGIISIVLIVKDRIGSFLVLSGG